MKDIEETIMSMGNINFMYVKLCIRRNRYQRMLKTNMPEFLLDREQQLISECESEMSDTLTKLNKLAVELGGEIGRVVSSVVDEEMAKYFANATDDDS